MLIHGFFTRKGGCSTGEFSGLNSSLNSGDLFDNVNQNRQLIKKSLTHQRYQLITLNQEHGNEVIIIDTPYQEKLSALRLFWSSLGANTTVMNFSEHDKNYAFLSHFPHLFSFIYREILDEENIDYKRFSGDSLKEILRLSEASEHLWHEIFLDNKENLEYIKEKLKKKLL